MIRTESPKLSIIMPVYNMADYIAQAIKSCQDQTLKSWELICIDDCSTDKSVEVVQSLMEADSRIRLIKQVENGGSGLARNKGIADAKGEFIAFLDPDDMFWETKSLEQLLRIAEKENIACVGGNIGEFDGDKKGAITPWGKAFFRYSGLKKFEIDYPYSIGYTRFIYRTKTIRDMGGRGQFPKLRRYQDPVWFASVMMHIETFYAVPVMMYGYRKNHQIIRVTPSKGSDILKGVVVNLAQFRVKGWQKHYDREQVECNYYLYKILYAGMARPFSDLKPALTVIREAINQSPDINWGMRQTIGLCRYSLTLTKKWVMYFMRRLG